MSEGEGATYTNTHTKYACALRSVDPSARPPRNASLCVLFLRIFCVFPPPPVHFHWPLSGNYQLLGRMMGRCGGTEWGEGGTALRGSIKFLPLFIIITQVLAGRTGDPGVIFGSSERGGEGGGLSRKGRMGMAWGGFPDSGRRTRRHSGRDAQKMANRGRHPPAHPTRRICIQPVELILGTQKNVT